MATPKRPVLAYIGTYSKANGKGIHLFEMNPSNGRLTEREVFPASGNPTWLTLNPDRTHLYAANEDSASVSAYAVDRSNGKLTLLNEVPSGGAGPAYVSAHPAGRHVLVANYAGGSFAVLPIQPNGEPGSATDIVRQVGPAGPMHAASGPKGSFAVSGHDHPHGHMIQSDPSGRFVMGADLGKDQILVWKFDAAAGKLIPNDAGVVTFPPGDGPRHFAFHPNGRWFYSLQEEASTLAAFSYDGRDGKLTLLQTLSTLPNDYAGTSFTSELAVAADGRFVYAANRLHNSIAIFSVDRAGRLALVGEEWTRGDYPRSFAIDPSGEFLFVCNHRNDVVTGFRVDRAKGRLRFTGQYAAVGSPAMMVFAS